MQHHILTLIFRWYLIRLVLNLLAGPIRSKNYPNDIYKMLRRGRSVVSLLELALWVASTLALAPIGHIYLLLKRIWVSPIG